MDYSHQNINENVAVAMTNLVALPAICLAAYNHELMSSLILSFAMSASIAYHLVECKKHDMPGYFPQFRKWKHHYYFINIDRLAASAAIGIYLPKLISYTQNYGWGLVAWSISSLLVMILSESTEYLRKSTYKFAEEFDLESQTTRRIYNGLKEAYIVTHSIWHVMAFLTALEIERKIMQEGLE